MAKQPRSPRRAAATKPTDGFGEWRSLILAFCSISACVILAYLPGLNAPFILDDQENIQRNPAVHAIWPLWGEAGRSPLRPPSGLSTSGRPLANLSLALNYAAGKLNTRGYHMVNVAIHIASAIILFALVRSTLALPAFKERFGQLRTPLACAVALLWALHPLNIDAVQYITQRTELLVGACYLLTLYSSLRYLQASSARSRQLWLIGATLSCLAGMASKEVMVTAPIVVLLYDRAFLAGSFREALRRSWPLYASLCATWVLLFALNISGPRSNSAGFSRGVSPLVWWATQARVLIMYLRLSVWPYPLIVHYQLPYIDTLATAIPWVAACTALVIATIWLVVRNTGIGFLAATALLVLLPTLVVPIPTEIAAERRMYLPLAAIVTLILIGGCYLLARRSADSAPHKRRLHDKTTWLWGLLILVSVAFIVFDRHRVSLFDKPLALWLDAAQHQPDNDLVQNSIGMSLFETGNFDEALPYFERARELNPTSAVAIYNAGVIHLKHGQLAAAEACFNEVIKINPDFVDAHKSLGVALCEAQRPADGVSHLEEVVRLRPEASAFSDLALAYAMLGRTVEAIEAGTKAKQLAISDGNYDQAARIDKFLGEQRAKVKQP